MQHTPFIDKLCEILESLFPELAVIVLLLVVSITVIELLKRILFKHSSIPSVHAWCVILQLAVVVIAIGLVLLDLSIIIESLPDWIFLAAGVPLLVLKDNLIDFFRMLSYPLRRDDSLTIGGKNGLYQGLDLGAIYLRDPRDPRKVMRIPISRVHEDDMNNDLQGSPRLKIKHYMRPQTMDHDAMMKAHEAIAEWFKDRGYIVTLVTNTTADSYLYVIQFYINTRDVVRRDRVRTEVNTVTIDILQEIGKVEITQEPK